MNKPNNEEFDDEEFEKIINSTEIERFLEEFNNRTIYKELSFEILETIPDDKIEQAILDYIDTKISDYRMTFEMISNMPEGFQMVYSTLALEGQVNNGGFNQFFFNSSGQYANMALQSLEMIGANDYYEILQKAIEIHWKERSNPELQNLYSLRTLDAFSRSYNLTSLGECDEKFYALGERLTEIRLKFIRSNPHLFIGS